MTLTTLVSTEELAAHLDDPSWVIADCRFMLAEPGRGEADYLDAHIPRAVYAHMERDLSGPVVRGVTARHPLPTPEAAAEAFSRWGIDADTQVVVYDASGGAMAARLWWLLRWLGHEAVAVLDGGWVKWAQEARPVRSGQESRPRREFQPRLHPEMFVSTVEVEILRLDPNYRLLDSRSADRFKGENETIDPVAGHIPGAVSAPYADNLTPDGTFLPVDQLQARFKQLLKGAPAGKTVFYCGSGVTAAHNVLALEHAGLGQARLYAGSWSEWITDPKRPVER